MPGGPVQEKIEAKITEALQPLHLEVSEARICEECTSGYDHARRREEPPAAV
jgi:hypothetical protein